MYLIKTVDILWLMISKAHVIVLVLFCSSLSLNHRFTACMAKYQSNFISSSHPDPIWFAECMGRTDKFDNNQTDTYATSGTRTSCGEQGDFYLKILLHLFISQWLFYSNILKFNL